MSEQTYVGRHRDDTPEGQQRARICDDIRIALGAQIGQPQRAAKHCAGIGGAA